MKLEYKEINNESQWDDLAADSVNCSFLQASGWASVKSINGWTAKRFAFYDSEQVLAIAQILIKKGIKGRLKIGYAARGPLVLDESINTDSLLASLQKAAKSVGIDHLTVDPLINAGTKLGANWQETLRKSKFSKCSKYIQRPNTGIVKLDFKDRDQLIKRFGRSRRSIVRRLGRSDDFNISVEGLESVADFHKLYQETGSKKGFGIRDQEYIAKIVESFTGGENSDCFMVFARDKQTNEACAASFMIGFGDVMMYFYGASSMDRKKAEASNLVQLHAMEKSQDLGYKTYDMGGAPDDPDNPDDKFANVWRFKASLGAELLLSAGCWQVALSTTGVVYNMAQKIKRLAKHLPI